MEKYSPIIQFKKDKTKKINKTMKVIKRDGEPEDVSFDKVINRIKYLCLGKMKSGDVIGESLSIDPITIAQKVINEIRDGITTRELDEFAAKTAASPSMLLKHPDYGILAGRIIISNHHKNTLNSFADTIKLLYENLDSTSNPSPLISRQVYKLATRHRVKIQNKINYKRDYNFDYFGFKTLERAYLIKHQTGNWRVQERPQHMWMRVALGIHGGNGAEEDLEKAFETYDYLSQGYFTHATPTLFNSGTPNQQLSSCFLLGINDSLDGIYKCLTDCAKISKLAGGIGIHVSNIRSKGSIIRGTNGKSNGIVPMLRNFNETARYIDQCFTPDTLIYTKSGTVPISKLSIGDLVLTKSGSFQKITRVLCHNMNTEIFKIKTKYNDIVTSVTGEHQILTLRYNPIYYNNQSINLSLISKRLATGLDNFEWVDAKELNVRDFICHPKSHCENFKKFEFSWKNFLLTPVEKIEKKLYDGSLYDLEVEQEHTYVTDNLGIVHNGGGKRMGSFAIYLEPWHPEILDFLDLKKNTGKEEQRARDLFYALWIPDLFMSRLKEAIKNKMDKNNKTIYWSTFCPDECPGLMDNWGNHFEQLYNKYENEGKARSRIDILKIWNAILDSQIETGTPYILYKDSCNRKSNQQNLGTIKSSNLCAEIIEFSDNTETAVCNLASIALPKHLSKDHCDTESDTIVTNNLYFDHQKLYKTVQILVRNLNKVIDINKYPTPEAELSNLKHRPMGIGVQGLADLFVKLRLPFDSEQASQLNEEIFETIYYSALTASNTLARETGKTYTSYKGSPASQGLLQFDLWNQKPKSGRWDWDKLKAEIKSYGLTNSLFLAVMPTASTAQILGNNEAAEPFTYNMYTRRVLAGEFTLVNKYLQRDLIKLGLWNEQMCQYLISNRGSIQNCPDIPDNLKKLYKGAFEISQKIIINMAADRGKYIDQSQSMNIFLSTPTPEKLTSMHIYGWEKGLKTGMYYLRREPIKRTQAFTIVPKNRYREKTDKKLDNENVIEGNKKQTTIIKKILVDKDELSENEETDTSDNEINTGDLCRLDDPTCLHCQG